MSIQKAFILGAGLGTRLRPLTEVIPKPLVPVWNEPLVHHVLRHCQQAGITEFAINTHHIPEAWEKQFPDGSFEGSQISFFHEPQLLETGGGIKNISSFIGDSPILIFNGDIISDIDLTGLIEHHIQSNNIATLAVKSNGPSCNIAVEGDQVTDIRHSLGVHPGNHQFTGIYCIQPEILQHIPSNEKISIIPAFLELVKTKQLGCYNVDAATWCDIGTLDTYHEVHASSPERNAAGSFISPLASVDENCTITDSIVWPGAVIKEHTSLEHCVVYSSTPVSGTHKDKFL